jgi:hypothetical protein
VHLQARGDGQGVKPLAERLGCHISPIRVRKVLKGLVSLINSGCKSYILLL